MLPEKFGDMMTLTQDAFFTEEELHSVEPPPFLVDGMLPMRSVNMLFGEFNIGKTFVALDMAAHVSIGKPWVGKDTEEGDVLYIASEGDPGNMGQRMEAWRLEHEIDFPLPMLFYADIVSLQTEAVHLVEEAVARGLRPRLIVVDTLSMALDDNENDNSVMNNLIKTLRGIQTYDADGEEYEISWLLVHHVGWGDQGRPRGGSSMPAGLDYVMGLRPLTEETIELFSYKAKNAAKFLPMVFKMKESAESIVYSYVPAEEAKLVRAQSKTTGRAELEQQFTEWTYYSGPMKGTPFTQALFRKAFDCESQKSNVSNMFKDHEEAGHIAREGNSYVAK